MLVMHSAPWFLKRQESDPNDHQTISTIKKQQNAWIAQRNKCGNDSQCLYKNMISRVETLNDDN